MKPRNSHLTERQNLLKKTRLALEIAMACLGMWTCSASDFSRILSSFLSSFVVFFGVPSGVIFCVISHVISSVLAIVLSGILFSVFSLMF